MRFQIARRILCCWAALGAAVALPFGLASAADSATSATLNVAGALREMADLESRIEQAQRQSLAKQRRLLDANRSLQSLSSTLERKGRLTREGEQFLKSYGDQVQAGVQSLDEQLESSRQAISVSRSAAGQATAALLAAGAEPSASAPELLALGLLQEAHRDRARLASRRILDLEASRAELAGKTEHAARSVQYQSVFSQYSLQQLRERHEALARQVAEVQAQASAQTRQVEQLASRRGELKQLMSRLAEQEAARANLTAPAAATPAPAPQQTPSLPEGFTARTQSGPPSGGGRLLTAAATPVPDLIPTSAQATAPEASEVPYEEGSAPLINPIRTSEDKDQTDPSGTRFLFWRARPVGVSAMAAGKVLFSGSFAGYRHLLILDHGGGWRSLYGNLVQCPLVPGATVQAGQSLGQYQAVQGARAEPLWFELRQGVQAVAPESWPGMPAQWQARLLTRL